MYNSIKDKNEAIDILNGYNGSNPYMLVLKKEIILCHKTDLLSEFNVEYIIKNKDVSPKPINKTISVVDWYGEKLKEKFEIEFIPEKLRIYTYFGETSTHFHCSVKYRQNMETTNLFIPKKAVLGNFLIGDYHEIQVDFDRYDNLSMSKDPNRRLKPHQKEAVQFLLHRKKCILADTMGTGKTTSLSVAAIEGNFDSILIICPASLKTNWRDELLWYVPEKDISIIDSINDKTKTDLEKMLGYGIGKSGLKREELLEEAKNRGKWEKNKFVIVNFDILDEFYKIPKTRSVANIEEAYKQSPLLQYIANKKSLIIIDESHLLSNSTSIRYKVINDLIKRGNPHSIYLATGTPVTNNPKNLYCLLKLIGSDVANDYQYYMDRFCGQKRIPAKGEKEKWTNIYLEKKKKECLKTGNVPPQSWYDLSSKEKDELKEFIYSNARLISITNDATNLDELKLKISDVYLRRTKEDIIKGLPKKTVHEVYYDFTPQQREEYNRLWDEYETSQLELDPEKELNKDLLEGAVYRKYCSDQMVPNTIKLANEFIQKGEKVIIATCYDDELYALKEYFGNKCVIYNGKMSLKQKDIAKDEFMNNSEKMVFIGNIQAASVGLTLISSHILIFNSFSYADSDNKQMQDRVYRLGQTKDCHIYFQIFKDTRYQEIWDICFRKEYIFNNLIKKEDEK